MFYIIFKFKKPRYTIASIRRGHSNLAKDYPIFLPKNKIKIMQVVFWPLLSSPTPFPLSHTKQHHNQFVHVPLLEMRHGK